MGVRVTTIGGTDWVDGNLLIAEDLIQTTEWEQILTNFNQPKTDYYFGTYNDESGLTLSAGGIYRFKSFTLSSATINVSSTTTTEGQPIVILVDGDFTMSGGTIDGSGDAGNDGPGGDTGPTPGAGPGFSTGSDFSYLGVGGGKGGNGSNGTGGGHGAGGTTSTFTYLPAADQPDTGAPLNFMNALAGTPGGNGGQNENFNRAGGGGAGGAAIIILVGGNLDFNGGTITCAGGDGGRGNGGSGSGGAGSGGMIILGCLGTLTNTGTSTIAGGTGGIAPIAGSGNDGGGGAGGSHQGGSGTNGASGTTGVGGDGGDGVVVTFTW